VKRLFHMNFPPVVIFDEKRVCLPLPVPEHHRRYQQNQNQPQGLSAGIMTV
jgi:hypothetical protein